MQLNNYDKRGIIILETLEDLGLENKNVTS